MKARECPWPLFGAIVFGQWLTYWTQDLPPIVCIERAYWQLTAVLMYWLLLRWLVKP